MSVVRKRDSHWLRNYGKLSRTLSIEVSNSQMRSTSRHIRVIRHWLLDIPSITWHRFKSCSLKSRSDSWYSSNLWFLIRGRKCRVVISSLLRNWPIIKVGCLSWQIRILLNSLVSIHINRRNNLPLRLILCLLSHVWTSLYSLMLHN